MSTNELIAIVPNHATKDKLRVALANNFGVRTSAVTCTHKDTEFAYEIRSETRLTKAKLATVQAFAAGLIVGMN